MKKKLLFVLMLIAAVVVMPRVHAAAITLGQVTNITNSDTLLSGSCTFDNGASNGYSVVTFTCDNASFKLLADDDTVSRPEGFAWIGFRVANATGATNYKVTFNGRDVSGQTPTAGFDDYIGFNEDNLKAAVKNNTNVVLSYVITWTADDGESATQTINVVINPKKIILLDEEAADENGSQVWNNTEYQAEVADIMSDLYKDLDATIYVAEHYDFSNYTAESIKAVEEAVAAAKAAGKDLTTNNQAAVIALRNAITNAIANLVVKGDEPVTPGSTNTDTSKPGEQAPDTFDAGLVYMGLALGAIGTSIVSVRKLRNN